MNQKGSLTSWNDAKGFGFITPEGGGERVFAHISRYAGRDRPVSDRKVSYSITKDDQGRLRAGRFQYAGAAKVGASIAPGVWVSAAVMLVFFTVLAGGPGQSGRSGLAAFGSGGERFAAAIGL
ncbi:cold shock domain-containing protein [Marinobacter sp. SS13-12]|uniref:cold shock domain-containing protein n=1 Tax=Marinobacter sp. SS13-12 TaxID=3050451 RepID=UPI0025529830|nr:cold shock domain-containing protein [Marinobacter sp. SS13-12]MDK8463473.1 cold shock domain-containing protein [Marinobacter sp. SS13-12]